MHKKLRRSVVAVLAAVSSVFLVMVGAAPAFASGYGYDGTNPVSTGCSASGTAIADYPIYRISDHVRVGTTRVMYSTACGTNWVAVDNWISGATAIKYIDRASPWFQQGELDTVTGWSFGMQAYAPGSTCITVQGSLTVPGNANYASSGFKVVC
jgi:hypothetical protein